MKFTEAAGANPTDAMRVLGRPTDRVEGPLKVSGQATYAAEFAVPGMVYGVVVGTTIATGRIVGIDTSDALAAPGVLAVMTHANGGALGTGDDHKAPMLAGPQVDHLGQAAALVVADGFEAARAAARLVRIDYAADDGAFDLAAAAAAGAEKPFRSNGHGDFDRAFADAPVQVDATYTTPDHAHAMMEPFASIAAWEGDRLTLWTANQMVDWAARDMAKILAMPRDRVRIFAHHVGGGFGGKLWVRADAVLAAVAARQLGRAVKVVLSRMQMFNNTPHRSATIQRLRLGADRGGRLQAIAHESWSGDLPGGSPEGAGAQTRQLYAAPNRRVVEWLAELNLPESNAMRAPGEAVGMMAIEAAMDELAETLAIDPVELRILNDTQVDPEKPERRFSHRDLIGCLREGAERFGWSTRSTTPGQRRDGRWLVGMGMAAAYRGNMVLKSAARVGIAGDGRVTVTTDMTDIGTGSYTILAQTAAEMLGIELEKVIVRLGESDFPVSAGSGGQFGANSSTAGVYAACIGLRDRIAEAAGFDPATARFADGRVWSGNRSVALGEAAGGAGIEVEDRIEFGDLTTKFVQATFGAHFVEVGVDVDTAEIRVRRMLGVFAAGRILNPKAARSQILGAMTMGVGAALTEALVIDPRLGGFINHDLAEYHVPTHADIPHQEVVFLDEEDPLSSPMKAKGVGELGICGVGAAVANAVYNATGVRVREYPITLDKVLAGMG
ncbi:xanthine dehydrogenase family protein molybdopterin-binding subunit [Sphingomonas sp. 2R-10]|uniref:xanthine dehydrogenase family protein molybdopterin-binding subunit n=1 Tax=Sphingomonas sp. 2R-10 TaxID=3045148 RepID=UPI000F78806D|nr:xanthine dehydrogenase family protein molybdopterin-binding subunit [Sphingomonas sp. 2R-10]MDJ0277611.1 xanthine dehydrogenase family protein molybdopterin-binding subunit [Sphingomonas sp. 2R-10]